MHNYETVSYLTVVKKFLCCWFYVEIRRALMFTRWKKKFQKKLTYSFICTYHAVINHTFETNISSLKWAAGFLGKERLIFVRCLWAKAGSQLATTWWFEPATAGFMCCKHHYYVGLALKHQAKGNVFITLKGHTLELLLGAVQITDREFFFNGSRFFHPFRCWRVYLLSGSYSIGLYDSVSENGRVLMVFTAGHYRG